MNKDADMDWLPCEGDADLWVRHIHKGRIVGRPFRANTIENMVDVPLRSDDVLVCSYPKSGCHWVWENIRMLLAGEVIHDTVQKETMMMEYHEHRHFDDYPAPRILNNHVYFDDQPSDLLQGRTKLVLVYRNPKDICVSFYHHHSSLPSYKYKGKFSGYIGRFLQGKLSSNRCFDYWKMWEEGLRNHPDIPYLLVRYEDLHLHPIAERRRIASFLGRDYSDEFLKSVADATDIETMRKEKDEKSLKNSEGNSIMYRKGKVGDWKDHFTVAQNEIFDGVVEKEMGQSKLFKFVYSIE